MKNVPWIAGPAPDPQVVKRLVDDAGLSPLVASLLVRRGITTREDAIMFIHPEYSELHNPALMADMLKAAERLQSAVEDGERILVYGDYDVDGTTAVALVASFLEGIGATVQTYVPHRYEEGYGVSREGVAYAVDQSITLMLTLDCGTKDFEPLAAAKAAGIDVIVCDHHLPEATLPEAFALLNPKRPDCNYPFKELSGCGVAFKLIQTLASRLDFPEGNIFAELDLVAISIGADLVDVLDENRILASFGMKRLREMQRPGIHAMLRAADIHQAPRSIRDISFTLGPRINAAGRMGHAKRAVDLLMEKDEQVAMQQARELEDMNRLRRDVDESTTRAAIERLEASDPDAFCNIVWGKEWHRGVVGIVASRLVEYRHRPSIVLSEEQDLLIGSARSVEGVDIHQALEQCADLLDQFGGHPMAAGLSLRKDKLQAFRDRIQQAVGAQLAGQLPNPEVRYDMEIELRDLTREAFRQLQQLEPFGPGNPAPVFLATGLHGVRPPRTVGAKGQHLKLTLQCASRTGMPIDAVGFNMGHRLSEVRNWKRLDAVFTVVQNTWRDRAWQTRIELNLHLIDLRQAEAE
jgi:single-stranded-DNA-specific exonuclease